MELQFFQNLILIDILECIQFMKHLFLGESEVEIKVIIQGLGHGDEITEPKGIETIMIISPEFSSEPEPSITALPMATGIHTVNIAEGSGTPGCEETLECYLPYSITISVGDTVTME